MIDTWPTTSWEIVKRYEAEVEDGGQPYLFISGFNVWAASEQEADTVADVHFRLLLTAAGIPWS